MFTAFKISHSFHSLKNFLTIFLSICLHCTAQVNSPRVYSLYCLRYVLRIQSSCEEIRPLCPAFQKTPIKCLAGSAFSVIEKNQICTARCRRIKIFFLLKMLSSLDGLSDFSTSLYMPHLPAREAERSEWFLHLIIVRPRRSLY